MVPLPADDPIRLQDRAGLSFHGNAHSFLLFERQRLRQFQRTVFVDGFDRDRHDALSQWDNEPKATLASRRGICCACLPSPHPSGGCPCITTLRNSCTPSASANPDPAFGNMLLEQFGGANGELAAAMQYTIQGLNCDDPAAKTCSWTSAPRS